MFNNDWDTILKEEIEKEYFSTLMNKVDNDYKTKTIYPSRENLFKAFKYTPYSEIKVVIIGQDPYHKKDYANGLVFSVNPELNISPSLRNIFKELKTDLNIERINSDLSDWAKQGIFLINAILTVEEGKPLSHKKYDWEKFTDKVIEKINQKQEPVVFILLGNYAKSKKKIITNDKHFIIESAHPSFFSVKKFWGNKMFSKTNEFLNKNNIKEIEW